MRYDTLSIHKMTERWLYYQEMLDRLSRGEYDHFRIDVRFRAKRDGTPVLKSKSVEVSEDTLSLLRDVIQFDQELIGEELVRRGVNLSKGRPNVR